MNSHALTAARSLGPLARLRPEPFLVATALAVFAACWTLCQSILGADRMLNHDILEAYAWGQEFRLGYHQHGPFWAWIAGLWFLVFPTADPWFILLEAVNAALGLLGAWKLNGLFAAGRARHAATLLLMATPFYSVIAFKFDANTIFVSLWPWALFCFVRMLDRLSARDAVGFGALAAAMMLSKYFAVVPLLSCALALPLHPNARRFLFSRLPWVALAVSGVLLLPHLVWLGRTDAPPVAYAMGLIGQPWGFTLRSAGGFLFDSVRNLALVAVLIALAWRASRGGLAREPVAPLVPWRRRFLAVMVLAPPLLTALFGLALRLRLTEEMAVGLFPLVPVLLMQIPRPLDGRRLFRLSGAVAVGVTLLAPAGAPVVRAMEARHAKGEVFVAPGRELAAYATRLWHETIGGRLKIVGGFSHYANAIAFYSPDHPSSFIDLERSKAPWITPARAARDGILIFCEPADAGCHARARAWLTPATIARTVTLGRVVAGRALPATNFDLFIVPPEAASPGGG